MALFVSYEDTLKLKLDMNELIELFEEAHRLLAQNKGTYGKRLRLVFPPCHWPRHRTAVDSRYENSTCHSSGNWFRT